MPCRQCGACCEVLAIHVFGHDCEHYDKENRNCKIYETRPEICRVTNWERSKPWCEKLRQERDTRLEIGI